METQAPIANSSSRSQKILFLFGGLIIASLFIAFNIWVYKQATKGNPIFPSAVLSPRATMKPDGRPSTTQKEPTSSSDSVGDQPTPLPPPPIPPDPVAPINVGPSSADPTTSPTPSK